MNDEVAKETRQIRPLLLKSRTKKRPIKMSEFQNF